MAASTAMINQVRRWCNVPDFAYEDDLIGEIIEQYPLTDQRGIDPFYWNTATNPPTQVTTYGWFPTYDLHAATAHIYLELLATKADEYDKTVSEPLPGTEAYSQVPASFLRSARYHNSLRSAQTTTLIMSPRRVLDDSYVINLAEMDEP